MARVKKEGTLSDSERYSNKPSAFVDLFSVWVWHFRQVLPLHNTQLCTLTHTFVTALNEKQGVDVVIAGRGGVIPRLRPNKKGYSASRTLFCLETNYFCASQIDFICLCSQARALFLLPVSLTFQTLTPLLFVLFCSLLCLSHPAPFNIRFICLSFAISSFQRHKGKTGIFFFHLYVCP